MPLPITRGALSARGFGLFSAPAAVLDPYFPYVTMLLHGDGTNGAQNNTFLDSSTNNFSITRNGNTTQGSFSPYGSNWSNYFDGTGDYLSAATNSAFDFGSGAFTIEGWVNISSFPAGGATTYGLSTLYATGDSDAATDVRVFVAKGSTLGGYTDGVVFAVNSTVVATSGSFTFNVGQWYHIAVTRSGNSIYIFIDGVLKSTTTYASTLPTATTYGPSIGATQYRGAGLYFVTGYISNVRVVKGTAVYTSAFTPSTIPLTAISGTSLLTCQSNRFIDNSTNNFTITRNGDVSVQRFSPFSPTAAYSTSTIGGSGYFDGSGDNLVTATNAAFTFGTGDFQIEMWVYPTDTPAQFDCILNGLAGDGVFFGYRSGNLDFVNNNDTAGALSTAYPTLNTWTHVAVVRSGTTVSLYKNGVRQATATSSFNWAGTSFTVMSGGAASYYQGGYVSDVRILKGATTYTPSSTTITIPTAPLTAVANTSLLLSYTNGAIYDNAMMNDLETVGNAQISTSVSKFGTGSIACSAASDYLKPPNSLSAALGTGDFTVECWLYISNLTGSYQPVIDTRESGGSASGFFIGLDSSGRPDFYTNGADRCLNASAISTGTWYHIAVCRSSGSTRLFVNGTQGGSTYTDANNYSNQLLRIGGNFGGTLGLSGYIDDLRITKGYARYTSNFSVPTAAFPNQ